MPMSSAHGSDDVISSEDDGSDHDDLAGDGDGEQSEDEDKHEEFLRHECGVSPAAGRGRGGLKGTKLEGLCDCRRMSPPRAPRTSRPFSIKRTIVSTRQ